MHTLPSQQFENEIGKLDTAMGRRAGEAVLAIAESSDPASLGLRKNIHYHISECSKCAVYAYEINRSCRILHCVGKDCLVFLRAGDHKTVHGKGR